MREMNYVDKLLDGVAVEWKTLGHESFFDIAIINFTSHSTLSNEAVAQPTPAEQATVKLLTDHLKSRHVFWQQQGV